MPELRPNITFPIIPEDFMPSLTANNLPAENGRIVQYLLETCCEDAMEDDWKCAIAHERSIVNPS